jgi:general secretion pathway protein K
MRRRGDRGVALLLALLVLVILILLVNQMTISSLHDRTIAENHLADLQNTYGTRSGYHQALLLLEDDLERGGDVDSLSERWAVPFGLELGKAAVQVTVVDSERFISLARLVSDKGEPNPLVAAQLRRLVRILRHPPDAADRIIDYIDADTRGAFESRARNDRLTNPEELLRVEGLEPEVLYGGRVAGEPRKGILEFVTVWPRKAIEPPAPPGTDGTPEPPPAPGSGGAALVNINTAPAEVLEALSDEMTPQAAEAIVAWRLQPGADQKPRQFGTVEDLKNVAALPSAAYASIKDHCTVKAQTFEVRARSRVGNVEKAWVFVVERGGTGGKKALKLLSSQRMNDFVTAKPPPLDE